MPTADLSTLGIQAAPSSKAEEFVVLSPSFDRSGHLTSYDTAISTGGTESLQLGAFLERMAYKWSK